MKTLLDSQSVALYFDGFSVLPDCIQVGDGYNWNYNASNTTTIDVDPPSTILPNIWQWQNNAWTCIDQAALDAYLAQQVVAANNAQAKKRHATYIAESDPIFFKWQRNEATQQEWLDKIAEIDARFPYMT